MEKGSQVPKTGPKRLCLTCRPPRLPQLCSRLGLGGRPVSGSGQRRAGPRAIPGPARAGLAEARAAAERAPAGVLGRRRRRSETLGRTRELWGRRLRGPRALARRAAGPAGRCSSQPPTSFCRSRLGQPCALGPAQGRWDGPTARDRGHPPRVTGGLHVGSSRSSPGGSKGDPKPTETDAESGGGRFGPWMEAGVSRREQEPCQACRPCRRRRQGFAQRLFYRCVEHPLHSGDTEMRLTQTPAVAEVAFS